MQVIGSYPFCNTGSVVIHEIDYAEDKVLASINCIDPQWYDIEWYIDEDTEPKPGFNMGDWFINLDEVMRVEEVQ